jgi:cytochrome b subunit of formate dehydrogenase
MPTMMVPLLIVWASIAAVLVVLLIYRSTLVIHEDDQLFLSDSENYMKKEQDEVQHRLGQIAPLVRVMQVGCAAVTLLIAGIWVWDMYKHF